MRRTSKVPFVVVLSRRWNCDDCALLDSSCAGLEVDMSVRHDELAVAKVAREYRPPCLQASRIIEMKNSEWLYSYVENTRTETISSTCQNDPRKN